MTLVVPLYDLRAYPERSRWKPPASDRRVFTACQNHERCSRISPRPAQGLNARGCQLRQDLPIDLNRVAIRGRRGDVVDSCLENRTRLRAGENGAGVGVRTQRAREGSGLRIRRGHIRVGIRGPPDFDAGIDAIGTR